MAGTGVGVGAPLLAPVWKGQDGELRLFAQTLHDELVGHFKSCHQLLVGVGERLRSWEEASSQETEAPIPIILIMSTL